MTNYIVSLFFDTQQTDPKILQEARLEVLKGLFILLSALLTAAATVLIFQRGQRADRQKQMEEASRVRRIRQEDVLKSLKAEIEEGLEGLRSQTKEDKRRLAVELASNTPFTVADQTNFIFDSIKSDVSVLPANVLDSVVRYYKLDERTSLLVEQMVNNPSYRKLSSERQENFVEGYLGLIERQKKVAGEAVQEIEEALADLGKTGQKQENWLTRRFKCSWKARGSGRNRINHDPCR